MTQKVSSMRDTIRLAESGGDKIQIWVGEQSFIGWVLKVLADEGEIMEIEFKTVDNIIGIIILDC